MSGQSSILKATPDAAVNDFDIILDWEILILKATMLFSVRLITMLKIETSLGK